MLSLAIFDIPSIPFIGVLISCDILDKKRVFALLARSASLYASIIFFLFFSSATFWFVTSIPTTTAITWSLLSSLDNRKLIRKYLSSRPEKNSISTLRFPLLYSSRSPLLVQYFSLSISSILSFNIFERLAQKSV